MLLIIWIMIILIMVAGVLTVVTHECSHYLMARFLGLHPSKIHIGIRGRTLIDCGIFHVTVIPLGGRVYSMEDFAEIDSRPRRLIAIAGPIGNILVGVIVLIGTLNTTISCWWVFGMAFSFLNILAGVANMVPIQSAKTDGYWIFQKSL